MTRPALFFFLALCVIACQPEQEGGPSLPTCTVDEGLMAGELQADVGGSSWSNTQTNGFLLQQVGLILPFTVDASNTVTFRLDTTSEFSIDSDGEVEADQGDDINDVFAAGAGPFEFSINTTDRSGADATLYFDGDAHHSGESRDGGYLKLAPVEESGTTFLLRGCFYFDAGPTAGSGDDVEVRSGVFAIEQSDQG